ncbi:glucokinase [Haloactinopolyspora alba]|uniref:Glucokinase n=1 Tax=Haloactinopolyspora alba TaxID=648780 RepID=A0A2P8DR60_9ACTN|nr:ROK family glucokinase [Haloactinopolyspora alba]PSK99699.1 glucokinase [Haloactinopolyspora alba]
MSLTIGVDVGGTKIAAGVVDEKGVIGARARRDTPSQDPDAIVESIIAVTRELAEGQQIDAVGVGSAGFVDSARSTVMFAPNLAWRDVPVRQRVADATGLPTVVENDANSAAWGEFRFGAAEDVDDMILLTIGTGVGGGVVLGGEVYRGAHGVAAEMGHIRMVPDGHLCGCGLRGCLEAYASGTALVREARTAASLPSAERLLSLAGGDSERITGPMVTAAAADGDELATVLMTQLARWLGEAMGSFTALFDPAVFVLGGGVSAAGDLLLGPAEETLRKQITGRGHRPEPEIRLATLGNDAGISGAADLARK